MKSAPNNTDADVSSVMDGAYSAYKRFFARKQAGKAGKDNVWEIIDAKTNQTVKSGLSLTDAAGDVKRLNKEEHKA